MFDSIIALSGHTGSGKTTVKRHLEKRGIKSIYTKDCHIALLPDLPPAKKMNAGDNYPSKHGFVSAVLSIAEAVHPMTPLLVFDSVRSIDEVNYLRTKCSVLHLVHIHCPSKERIRRLIARDAASLSQIEERDAIDLGKKLGSNFDLEAVFREAEFTINTFHDSGTALQIDVMLITIGQLAIERASKTSAAG